MPTTKIDDDEDDRVLRDGERIVVRLDMMDATQRHASALTLDATAHRPGFRGITADTAAADASREAWLAELRDAWRSKPTAQPQHQADVGSGKLPEASNQVEGQDVAAAALAAHNEWLKDAWRSA